MRLGGFGSLHQSPVSKVGNTRIFYYCYDHNRPSGGQRDTYWHVDVLNREGVDAYVLHTRSKFRLTWFENDTKIVDWGRFERLYAPERDYLVLPEDLGSKILLFPGRKIIFHKGLWNGFACFGADAPAQYPYSHRDVVAVFAVSEHNIEHLRFAFPAAQIMLVRSSIDPAAYRFTPLPDKLRQIAYSPKGRKTLSTLYHLLQARAAQSLNRISDYRWHVMDHLSAAEGSALLEQSLLFVFLNIEEGLPRSVLEALCCGCIVAGYDAGPMKECLPQEFRFAPGGLIDVARFIESVTNSGPGSLSEWESVVAKGRQMALSYCTQESRRSVLQAWEQVLSQAEVRRRIGARNEVAPLNS